LVLVPLLEVSVAGQRKHSRHGLPKSPRVHCTRQIERCSSFIPETGKVLDWGCNHAPTACMVKMLRGDAVDLYGCDVEEGHYDTFFNFANLQYSPIRHPYIMPDEDDFFDCVIGTAALEHVPNDNRSLEELYRTIKMGGLFIMTTLPNRYSYTEWLNRTLKKSPHRRIYSLKQIKRMFLSHGFLPLASGYHQVFPSLCTHEGMANSKIMNAAVNTMASYNGVAERTWPFRCVASNLFVVAKKVYAV
jgi:SAM-dependent methyltransferase